MEMFDNQVIIKVEITNQNINYKDFKEIIIKDTVNLNFMDFHNFIKIFKVNLLKGNHFKEIQILDIKEIKINFSFIIPHFKYFLLYYLTKQVS